MLYRSTPVEDLIINEHYDSTYKLGEFLGQGTSGKVYKASHKESEERVAIKIVSITYENEQDMLREIAIVKSLSRHPYVADCFEVFSKDGILFIAMEYLQGGNLDKYSFLSMRRPKEMGSSVRKNVTMCILMALRYLDSVGVIHRDIKPANIMLCDASGRAKLIDFGLATAPTDGEVMATRPCGSPYFAAPEVIRLNGCPAYGTKADMWSFGVTMMSLIVDPYPEVEHNLNFESEYEEFCYFLSEFQGPWGKRKQRTPFTEVFLKGCLQWYPYYRYSAAEMIKVLREVVDDRRRRPVGEEDGKEKAPEVEKVEKEKDNEDNEDGEDEEDKDDVGEEEAGKTAVESS